MKHLFLLLFTIYFSTSFAQQAPPAWMFDIIQKTDLELVYGNEFPYINPLTEGSFGSPIIEGLLNTDEKVLISKSKGIYSNKTKQYFIFLCRKKNENSTKLINENESDFMSSYNYYSSFNYYLTFVVLENKEYKIKQVYKWYLLGMQENIFKIDNEVRFTKLISRNSKQDYDYDYYEKNKIKISKFQNLNPIIITYSGGYTIIICYNDELYYHKKDYE